MLTLSMTSPQRFKWVIFMLFYFINHSDLNTQKGKD